MNLINVKIYVVLDQNHCLKVINILNINIYIVIMIVSNIQINSINQYNSNNIEIILGKIDE